MDRFLARHRRRHQFDLAAEKGYRGRLQIVGARKLVQLLGICSSGIAPASLLSRRGAGTAAPMTMAAGIFDPAVYFGDREADIAMTRLFGGFGPSFYTAYLAGRSIRRPARPRTLYNLYHVLNHLDLFGGAYLAQASR